MPSRLGLGLLAAGIAGAAVLALLSGSSAPPPIGRGSPAPDFELPALSGGSLRLSELRGRVVLLNFWATWCKPCEDEMPAMERLHRQLQGQGLALLAVSVDDAPEPVEAFRRRLGLSFPILLDPGQEVSRRFQTFRFPETLLIDREGSVVDRFVGPKDWDAELYVDRIRRLLGSAAPS